MACQAMGKMMFKKLFEIIGALAYSDMRNIKFTFGIL